MGYIEIFLFVTFFAGILFLGFLFFFFVVFLWQYVIQYFVKNSKHNASSFSDKYVSSFVAYKGIDHSYKQHKRSSSPKNKEHDFKRRYTYLRKKRLSYIFGHFLYGLSWLFRFRAFKATPGSPSLLDNFCAVCKLPQFRPLRLVFVGGGFFMFAFIFFTVLIFRFAPDSSAADFTLSCSGTSGSPTNVTSSSYTASDSLVLEDGGSGYCVLDDVLTIGSLTIDSGVTLVHAANDSTGVKINAIGDVTVNGDIDVSSKGCLGTYGNDGSGPDDVVSGYDAYSCALRNAGYGNSHGDGSPGPGGGYGGAGGNTIWGGLGGVAYGSSTYPIHLGSSAGGSLIGFNNSTGGAGGGLIWISASGTLSVSGNVVSDGGLGGSTTYGASGGGSGGSIFLDADSISGSGIVRADGGDGSPPGDESVNYQDRSGGGGGGGRVYLTSCSDVSTFTTSTDGGLGPYAASDGSIGTWVTLARAGASCNTVPTATDPTVTTSTDGSGNISISTQVDDADNDNLQLIVEYKLGDCSSYASQSTTTLSSTITATNGQGSITHDNDDINSRQFQVIDTLSGANTLGFTWTSKTDVPSADGQYCLFLTPYDGASNGTVVSSTVTIDNTIPTSIGYPSVSVTSTT
ncbi:MAG: hypothetical protein HOJ29_03415, partial [Candidatus Magasanikbacteria bacterium]|nr:hypothetical protein [Candidatus Magasanikbacteria bacterium]